MPEHANGQAAAEAQSAPAQMTINVHIYKGPVQAITTVITNNTGKVHLQYQTQQSEAKAIGNSSIHQHSPQTLGNSRGRNESEVLQPMKQRKMSKDRRLKGRGRQLKRVGRKRRRRLAGK